ncbi:MAG: PKD domain-containing protein [Methanobacteriota archaeon]
MNGDARPRVITSLISVLSIVSVVLSGCIGQSDSLALTEASSGTPGLPVAVFSVSPIRGEQATLFTFDGTGSKGSGLAYAWEFGDGDVARGDVVTHQFRYTNNLYAVKLVVTDASGLAGETTVAVPVGTGVNGVPSVTLTTAAKRWVEAGTPIPLDASQASDPDGDPLTHRWSYQKILGGASDGHAHDHGDGAAHAEERTGPEVPISGDAATIQHAFAEEGLYKVLATVLDPKGGRATDVFRVKISDFVPKDVFTLEGEGMLHVGTTGSSVGALVYNATEPKSTYQIDSDVYEFILRYPGRANLTLSWDGGPAGANDLDFDLRNVVTGEHVAVGAGRSVPGGGAAETGGFDLPAGEYVLLVKAYTGAEVAYALSMVVALTIDPDIEPYQRSMNA